MAAASGFSDRAFCAGSDRILRPPALSIARRARLPGKDGAPARGRAKLPGAGPHYPGLFPAIAACRISVFHFGPFTFMPAASPGAVLPSPRCGRTQL